MAIRHFIETYLEYTKSQESPESFHLWTAMAMLSAALGQHVYYDRRRYKLCPNLYVFLVAGSAKCRKSVAMGQGMRLLRKIENPPMVFSTKITTEALIGAVVKSQAQEPITGRSIAGGLLSIPELAVFLGKDARDGKLIALLTDLYDFHEEWAYETKIRGVERVQNVCLSMLAATTIKWLKQSLTNEDIGGGFTSRVLFVYEQSTDRNFPSPEDAGEEIGLAPVLVRELNRVSRLRGAFRQTPESKAWYEEWYQTIPDEDGPLGGYFGRKHDHAIKVAMVLSAAEGNSLIIEKRHMQRGVAMMDRLEESMRMVYEAIAMDEFGERTEDILGFIRSKPGGVLWSELARTKWRAVKNMEELEEHIGKLLGAGIVQEVEVRGGRKFMAIAGGVGTS